MSEEEMLEQLYSLIEDRSSFILNNSNDCEIFKKDKLALEMVIEKNKELKSRIDKAIEKLSFIDNALEEDILSGFLCIVKINNTIKILRGDSNE